jgi:hypothetical protein
LSHCVHSTSTPTEQDDDDDDDDNDYHDDSAANKCEANPISPYHTDTVKSMVRRIRIFTAIPRTLI